MDTLRHTLWPKVVEVSMLIDDCPARAGSLAPQLIGRHSTPQTLFAG
jgi:hypothetical protein